VVVYGTGAPEASVPGLWLMQNSATLQFFLIYDISQEDRAAAQAELNQRLEQGRLIHAVGRRLPLAQIADAHEAVERGEVIGNVVLDIDAG
jgi:NADPH:quinone reductase